MIKNNYYKLLSYWFFHSFILAYVIERLYWQSRGISVIEVVYLEIVYNAVIILLEIPTGYLADRWKRKNMMILGALATCFEFGILIFAHGFFQFSLSVASAAFGTACTSGTSNALLYDSLKTTGEEAMFEQKLGRIHFADGASHAVAALLGGLAAFSLGLVSTYYISFVSTVIALLISFTLIEPRFRSEEEQTDKKILKEALVFFKSHASVTISISNGLFIAAIVVYVDEFWQLYLEDLKVPVAFFGIVSVLLTAAGSLGSILASAIKKKLGYKKSMIWSMFVFCGFMFLTGIIHGMAGIIFLVLLFFPASVIEVLVYGYLHQRVRSHFRATSESIQSFGQRILSTGIGLIFGFIAETYRVATGYVALSCLTTVYLLIYLLFLNRKVLE